MWCVIYEVCEKAQNFHRNEAHNSFVYWTSRCKLMEEHLVMNLKEISCRNVWNFYDETLMFVLIGFLCGSACEENFLLRFCFAIDRTKQKIIELVKCQQIKGFIEVSLCKLWENINHRRILIALDFESRYSLNKQMKQRMFELRWKIHWNSRRQKLRNCY